MREFKKMAINIGFILKHCFPAKTPTRGSGYSMIQRQNHRSEFTMKDVLYQLASSYKLMNPIRGVIPVSPTRTIGVSGIQHDIINQNLEKEQSTWYKEATKYVKERIKPDSRYKLRKYIDDPTLNKIRYDRSLFHVPHSVGSYVDAKTGKRTCNGKNAKQNETVSKIRRCGPRCIVCVAIADPDDKDAKISQTTTICSTCLVPLCNKKIGNRKTTCFERFHQVSDLSQLVREKKSSSRNNSSSGKKRKHANNNNN